MSTIGTIVTGLVLTMGAVSVAKQLRKSLSKTKKMRRDEMPKNDGRTIELEPNPETGIFERKK